MGEALKVLGITAVMGEPIQERTGRWMVTLVVRAVFEASRHPLALARVTLRVKSSLRARESRHEAVGVLGREPGILYAHVALPTGRVWVALEEESTRRWGFDIAKDGRPPKTVCSHQVVRSSWMEGRLWMADVHATLCGVQRVCMQACCQSQFAPWREFQSYDLSLFVPLEGPVRMVNGAWQGVVPKGSYLVSNPVDKGGPADDQQWPVTYLKIVISQSLLKGVRERLGLSRSLGPFDFSREPQQVSSALQRVFDGWGSLLEMGEGEGLTELARSWSSTLIVTLLREHPNQLKFKRAAARPSSSRAQFHRVVSLLADRLSSSAAIEEVASESGFSLRSFRRLFHEHTGERPKKYLQELRVARAKDLLKDPSLTVETVARKVGYHDVSTFYKMFKLYAHHLPRKLPN